MCTEKDIIKGRSEIFHGVWHWGREGDGRGGAVPEYMVTAMCKERKHVLLRLLWARVKRERECLVFISAYQRYL